MSTQNHPRSSHSFWLLGVFVWALFSLFSTGYDSPDEHFPTLEAAGGLIFGYWYPTWEWNTGLRSWIQPLIEAAWLTPFVKIGITHRPTLDSLLKIFNSALWVMGALASRRISKNLQNDLTTAETVGLSTLFAFPFVIWGTHHGSDLFCIPFFLMSLCFLTDPQKKTTSFFLFGLFSALTFQIRFTAGPLIALTAMSFFIYEHFDKKLIKFCAATAGFLMLFFALNALDRAMYVNWLNTSRDPIYEFFKFNILEGSKQFHASPFWEPLVYSTILVFPSLVFARFKLIGQKEYWLAAPILAMLLLWMSIRHFEFRFLMPMLALVILMIAKDRRAIYLNMAALCLAFIFYRDPHGAQIQALSELDNKPLVFVDATGGAPVFYSKYQHAFKNLDGEKWKRLCQGDSKILFEQKSETWSHFKKQPAALNENWSHFQVITPEKCPTLTHCTLQNELRPSQGRKLRALVSKISAPGFVYNCEL